MLSILRRVKEGWTKARLERALVHRSFPQFVSDSSVADLGNSIPVFCFHAVGQEFEKLLKHLQRNGYTTLSGDELIDGLASTENFTKYQKPVVLTFDDGWRSTWTIAYPLLKRYGFHAISFLVPTWMNEYSPSRTIDDVTGADAAQEIADLERQTPYLSWSEAQAMQADGVFEFQSHSMTHDTVFTSSKIVDFVNPSFHRVPHKIPLMADMPLDPWQRSQALGMPLHTVAPRLTGAQRFPHNESLRQACLATVRESGGEQFFARPDWRTKLESVVAKHNDTAGGGQPDSAEQRDAAIRRELLESKQAIEAKLDAEVRHFCFPFYAGSEIASEISAEVGYASNHWGWMPSSDKRTPYYGREHLYAAIDETDYSTGETLENRRTNRVGDNPFRIVRVPGDYIERLPGDGRSSLLSMFIRKCVRNLKRK